MNTEVNRMFDFSGDALLFRKRLLKKLQEEKMELGATELTDDDLAYVNAAGVTAPVNKEEPGKEFPFIP